MCRTLILKQNGTHIYLTLHLQSKKLVGEKAEEDQEIFAMGLISSVVKCFCFGLTDEYQPSEQQPTKHFRTTRDPPIDISHDQNGEFQDCFINLSAESFGSESQECLDYHSDLSFSDSVRQGVLMPSASFLSCENSVLHGTFLQQQEASSVTPCLLVSEAKKQDADLLEEMYSDEPNREVEDRCLLESVHVERPVEEKQGAYIVKVVLKELSIAEKQDVCIVKKTRNARVLKNQQGVFSAEDQRGEKPIRLMKNVNVVGEERWIKHYSSLQKILLVGEGDFSFSSSLANAFGSAHNITATSLDAREFLRENYRRAISNIENLTKKGCKVIHVLDAKVMAKNPVLKGMKFDRIVFNFPFAGFFKELPREHQLRRHRSLVSCFLKNAKEMINQSGEIHITHKTNNFHSEWHIEQIASCHGLSLVESVNFCHRDYPGYMTMRGFGGDNYFFCYPCKTYKFGLQTAR